MVHSERLHEAFLKFTVPYPIPTKIHYGLNRHIKIAEQRTIIIVIGTLAVGGRAVTFGTARRGLGGTHPSTASVPTSYYSMWHYNCLWSV